MKKLTTEEFIYKAELKHGNKYDYSLVDYINSKTKIKIICSEHGIFEQLPSNHLAGQNCMKCSIITTNNKNVSNKKQFIKKVSKIHGNKYDYKLVCYKNNRTKVKIICPEHGVFEQTPIAHVTNRGCPDCGRINANNKMSSSTEEFIKKAKQVHSNKYDYSLVDYKNNKTKIKIICPEHGIFEQIPSSHLQKIGCPVCNESKGEKIITKYLNNKNIKFLSQYTFAGCKNIKLLSFDFYLPNKNILIEYDGEQHFKPIRFFGGIEKYKKQIINDDIKNEYCKKNNIKLYRIRYDEDIKLKLKELICER